ncbi:cytosolic sulfotransferase 2-like [Stegastes partitus]|uniref:Sulfotransferase n=1 Tax=Stegastes partitus TaxID=144197 RepID=A0A9Y4K3Z2_9TELE|nr:PREDICTED: cytosolic sulfotransferase 2-like [Stegastes partitus]
MELPPRPTVFDFHGIPMIKMFTDNWDNVQDFKARPDDILIVTYPKAGTTWTSYILDLLYFGHMDSDRQTSIPINRRVPFLEMAKASLPTGWIMRNLMIGSWFDHVTNWWEKKQTYSNIHYMFYEDLSQDLGREVDQLCSFLGLSPSAEDKEKLRTSVTFDSMKQNKMTNYSTVPTMNQKVSPFMRKGKVGDWKNHFTVSQNEKFDEVYKQKMKNSILKFHTEC